MTGELAEWRRWVEQVVGPGARVVRSRPFHGGVTSRVDAVDVDSRAGRRHRLVLRRYRSGGHIEQEPGLVDAEAVALEQLAAAGLAGVPRLVASDPHGRAAGRPALLSTRLPGNPIVAPADPVRWVTGLARATIDVCERLQVIPPAAVPPLSIWYPVGQANAVEAPSWVRDRVMWTRAMARVADRMPESAAAVQVIHRDLNPGNVLWHRGRPSGIVDWVNLCAGPIEEDVARCRFNIWLLAGRSAAHRFLAEIRGAGVAYDLTWELVLVAEMTPDVGGFLVANKLGARLTERLIHRRLEALVRAQA